MPQPAKWQIFDEADAAPDVPESLRGLTLQIDLGQDHMITLTIREGEPPEVRLWQGPALEGAGLKRVFDRESRASFRAWLDQMALLQGAGAPAAPS